MEEKSPIKLSICIPTLNRGSFIGETLESILSQANEEVEVVIVDGGSTDNTEDIVEHYQQSFPNLRYVRGGPEQRAIDSPAPSNGGFDRDCNRAVELAKGEYCWLFTDDDLLKRGAIQKVLDAARQHYGLIIVNAEVRSVDLSKLLEPKRLQLSADQVYKPSENQRLFTSVGEYLTFVGGVVVRRQLWNARKKEPYFGSGFIHVGMIFQAPVSEDTLVIAEPLIVLRYGNAIYMHTSRYFEIWMFRWPNLIWSLPGYSDTAKGQLCQKEPWRRKRTLLLFRAKGAFSIREYRDWLESRISSRWHRFTTKFIARFPGSLANLIGVIHHLAFGHWRSPSLVDLVDSPFYFGRGLRWLRREK